jgi:chromosome segregation ATPase
LEAAAQKVVDLEGAVSKKAEEVSVLELKVKKAKGQSAALKKELEAKQAELAELHVQLDEARAEAETLRQDLSVSREETRSAQAETRVSRGETTEARWQGFKSDVVLSVCEKGNRKKLSECRDEVREMLDSKRAARFKQCVGSRQAQPRLVRVDEKEKDPELPRWSEWLSQESKFTQNKWYVVFCDPTLPEASFSDGPEDEGDL